MDVPRFSSKVRKLLADLAACPTQVSPAPDNEHIHRIRVLTKKLRAWLRLLQPELPHEQWKQLDCELRDMGRKFSGARDQAVLRQTLLRLREGSNKTAVLDAILIVEPVLQKRDQAFHSQSLLKIDTRVLRKLRKLQRSKPLPETLCKGLLQTHKKALRLGRAAYASNNDFERLHALRKWLKYLAYQLDMLGFVKQHPRIYKRLQRLGTRLGDIHDLVVLKQSLTDALPEEYHNELALIVAVADSELEKLIKNTSRPFRKFKRTKPLCDLRKIRAA